MAAEVDQATAQEQITPVAQSTSDAAQPPKAPEDAVGVKPPEDKAPGDKAVADAKFPDADGKNDDSAPQDAQAAPTEPAKAEDVVADTTPVGTAAGGAQQQDIAPKEDVPSVTGAASGDAPAQPPPSDLPAAPAADAAAKEPSTAEEKPAAAETNGAQKDADVGEQPPVPAPEEAVGAPASTGEKRKAEEEPVPTNGDAKKAKVDDANGAAAANGKPEAKKPGRPSKKDKKPVEKAKEAVGRTLRKTRSQGPIDQ